MEKKFWHDAWRNRQIGFHRSDIHPMLLRHWPERTRASGDVLVPLCGKTLDMRWLAERGHGVTGIELDEGAIREFFTEWGIEPDCSDSPLSCSAEGISLLAMDFFEYRPSRRFPYFYDRAALVALPHSMRGDYLARLAELVESGGEGLLITFEYDQGAMDGPPFSVPEQEVRGQRWFEVERLERSDVTASHPGLVQRGALRLVEVCYWLRRL